MNWRLFKSRPKNCEGIALAENHEKQVAPAETLEKHVFGFSAGDRELIKKFPLYQDLRDFEQRLAATPRAEGYPETQHLSDFCSPEPGPQNTARTIEAFDKGDYEIEYGKLLVVPIGLVEFERQRKVFLEEHGNKTKDFVNSWRLEGTHKYQTRIEFRKDSEGRPYLDAQNHFAHIGISQIDFLYVRPYLGKTMQQLRREYQLEREQAKIKD